MKDEKPKLRYNERQIALMNAETEDPQHRARTSRLQKWKELVQDAQKQLQLPSSAPTSIQCLWMPLDMDAFGQIPIHFLEIVKKIC